MAGLIASWISMKITARAVAASRVDESERFASAAAEKRVEIASMKIPKISIVTRTVVHMTVLKDARLAMDSSPCLLEHA
jgi:hypothetical protein